MENNLKGRVISVTTLRAVFWENRPHLLHSNCCTKKGAEELQGGAWRAGCEWWCPLVMRRAPEDLRRNTLVKMLLL